MAGKPNHPGEGHGGAGTADKADLVHILPGNVAAGNVPASITSTTQPSRQLSDLPKDELEHLAEQFGLEPRAYKTRQALVTALHDRRQLIAATDRAALLDVVRWGRRPVTANASNEQIAQEILRIKSMRFAGLSQRGLLVLACLRGVRCGADEAVPSLIKKLKKKEGFWSRVGRKRRAWIGKMVSGMIGENVAEAYQFLPGGDADPGAGPQNPSLKEEIEEQGLVGGLTNRLKRTADSYINQKLDEIEARLDRKLDEIDRRLGEWRDKEIANRLRILKITLWASVIVGAFSLVYAYVKVYIVR